MLQPDSVLQLLVKIKRVDWNYKEADAQASAIGRCLSLSSTQILFSPPLAPSLALPAREKQSE